jgi:hypothetical protein
VTTSIDMIPIPNLAYYLVVNVRCISCLFRQMGKASPSRGGRSRTHVRRVGAGCPYRWTTPLRVFICESRVGPMNTKEPPPFGSGSSTNRTYVSPRYAVEGTSSGLVVSQLNDCALDAWAMARPREVKRPLRPSEYRSARQLYAWTCFMFGMVQPLAGAWEHFHDSTQISRLSFGYLRATFLLCPDSP